MRSPSSQTWPESGLVSAAKRWSSVVFPEPEGPMSATLEPDSTSSERSRSTENVPPSSIRG